MVYAREVEGKTLTFQVSGMLWNQSLVMRDVETGSLWSHILGECMEGPLKGKTLRNVASVMTTWHEWRKTHPETVVLDLSRTVKGFRRDFYKQPGDFVFGIVHEGKARAYRYDTLLKQPILEDVLGETPVVITFDRNSMRAAIFSRRLHDKTIVFKAVNDKGFLVDRGSGSFWNPLTGMAEQGPRQGEQLTQLPGIVSFLKAWRVFHPDSTYWTAPTRRS